jgi:hypothetical protein
MGYWNNHKNFNFRKKTDKKILDAYNRLSVTRRDKTIEFVAFYNAFYSTEYPSVFDSCRRKALQLYGCNLMNDEDLDGIFKKYGFEVSFENVEQTLSHMSASVVIKNVKAGTSFTGFYRKPNPETLVTERNKCHIKAPVKKPMLWPNPFFPDFSLFEFFQTLSKVKIAWKQKKFSDTCTEYYILLAYYGDELNEQKVLNEITQYNEFFSAPLPNDEPETEVTLKEFIEEFVDIEWNMSVFDGRVTF